jgi:tRNA nucleotidyltransferase (CCA-adding enzyme)
LPEVRPSASLREDLYRRDFTVNAMAIQLDGVWFGLLHDPYGGSVDLRRKRLRVLHEGSFSDDPTRIFRAIRFMQRFGFQVERSTKHWLIQAASTNLINRLSAPRLGNEILLLLDERYPAKAIQILARLQLLRFLHARLRYREKAKYVVAGIARTLTWWKSHNLAQFDRSLLYLIALLSETERSVSQTVARRLALSAKQCRTVEWAGRRTDRIVEELSRRQAESPSRVYRLLDGAPHEAILLALAKCRDPSRNGAERRCRQRILRYLKKDRNVTITIKGEDLMRLGLKPGPQYKKILDRLLNARLDGNVTTEAEERELAHDLVKKARPHVDATVGVIANRSRSY